MSVLFDAIRVIHNSFRRDTGMIDRLTNLPFHEHGNLVPVLERYKLYNEALIWNDTEKEYLYTEPHKKPYF